jgi:hypothetical protein
MYNENKLTPAQQELESALSQIRPTRDALNHELFLFNAGRASASTKRPWQMISGVLTILLLCSVLIRPAVDVPARESSPAHLVAFEETPSVDYRRPSESPDASAYLTLRQSVVRRGLNALPSGSGLGSSTQRVHQKQWLESLL